MHRRRFLQGMIATAGATALPAPVISKAATHATTKVVPFHYGWACVYAQMNNGVSAADIERVFKISPHEAQGLMDRMLTRGVIRPPGLDGRSHPTRAWEPWDKKTKAATKHQDTDESELNNTSRTGARARDKFQKMMLRMKNEPHYLEAI